MPPPGEYPTIKRMGLEESCCAIVVAGSRDGAARHKPIRARINLELDILSRSIKVWPDPVLAFADSAKNSRTHGNEQNVRWAHRADSFSQRAMARGSSGEHRVAVGH